MSFIFCKDCSKIVIWKPIGESRLSNKEKSIPYDLSAFLLYQFNKLQLQVV